MTIICALCDENTDDVWIGCNDGVAVGDIRMHGATRNKWLIFGHWALAIAGSSIPVEALKQYQEHFPNDEDSPHAITQFIKNVFDEVEIGTRDEDDPATCYPMVGLLAHRDGRIWDLDSYLVTDHILPGKLWARGSGMSFALGADFVSANQNATSDERVQRAVDAAIFYDYSCPGQAFVQRLDPDA